MNIMPYFYNMLMKRMPLEDSSVSLPSETAMREGKLLVVVQGQFVLTVVCGALLQKRPLHDYKYQEKKKSRTGTRQVSKAT